MSTNFVELLGYKIEDPAVQLLLASLGPEQETCDLEGEFSVEFLGRGVALKFDLARGLSSVFLEGPGLPGARAGYSGHLTEGLEFSTSRNAVHRLLGEPTASGGAQASRVTFGQVPPWDQYDRPDYSLHLQYGDQEGAIQLVSLMAPWRVPGRGGHR